MSLPTQAQAEAIRAEGDVLVMAGAGTGKTRTLVDRLVDRLTRQEGRLSLDQILMVTFTEAAAAEMRVRLRDRLLRLAVGSPGDAHLARQLLLLDSAAIGTLHGFCLRLIRDHFHELGLDPQLEVMDAAGAGRLASETLSAVLDPLYGGTDDLARAVQDLAQRQFDGDLDRLESTLLGLHARLRSLADPDDWRRRASAAWEHGGAEGQRAALEAEIPRWAADWRDRLEPLGAGNPKAGEVHGRLSALAAGTVDPGTALAGLAGVDEEWPRGQKTRLRRPLAAFFDEVTAIRSWWEPAPGGGDPVAEDWGWCRPRMLALLEVLDRFALEYARRKKASGRLDFADLEQFALDLLGHRPTGAGRVAPAAAACREQYALVLVDEAQDVNEAQDAILRAVARPAPDGNRFLVGDVKQSIYRFRFADPRLFQAYARRWADPAGPGRVLPLTGNFRSAESLLGFVNAVFHAIQRPEVGGVAYDADARLGFGAPEQRAPLTAAADPGPRVEVHLQVPPERGEEDGAEEGGDPAEDDLSRLQTEARRVAARLRELRDGGLTVWDEKLGGFRQVGWGDMAVLLRAERSRIPDFASAFRTVGVPLVARQGDFFTRLEVSDLHATLELVDNPLQDIPLLAVLRSPLVGMSDVDELAVVRMLARREERWWTLLQRFHEAGRECRDGHPDPGRRPVVPPEPPPLVDGSGRACLEGEAVFAHPATAAVAARAWERVDRFLRLHGEWRQRARQGSVRALIESILDDTGYEDHLAALPGSADALANVRQLIEVARRFDRSQRGGVYRFLAHLRDLHSADSLEAGAGVAAEDAVQLLTIHRSKGLEFPVVAVANLGSPFHLGDLHGARVLFHEERGLCPRVVPPTGGDYPSLPLWMARREEVRERLGEEIRLLYVALTRARDRLLLFGTARRTAQSGAWVTPAEAACAGGDAGGPRLALDDLLTARSPLDWLGPALGALSRPDWAAAAEGTAPAFTWRVHAGPPDVAPAAPPASATPNGEAGGIAEAVEVSAPASPWVYPHRAATREPAKTTVTALRRRADAGGDDSDEAAPFPGTRVALESRNDPVDRTAADRGILHHRFLEFVDPQRADSEAALQGQLEAMVGAGRFTAEEAAALDLGALARFWASPLGLRVRQAAGIRREFEFTFRLDAIDLQRLGIAAEGLDGGEFVVAQGIVDLAFEEEGGLVVVDFKTDAVAPGRATGERAAGYRPQLAAYALALARILRLPVRECWLHFLANGSSVPVDVPAGDDDPGGGR